MPINTRQARAYLRAFDFRNLFIEVLGWNRSGVRLQPVALDGRTFTFTPIAEQGGMLIAECQADDGNIPQSGTRAKCERHITALHYEHILIFTDGARSTSLWRWVKREQGRAGKAREHTYRREQPGDSLLQRLADIAFKLEELDDEGRVSIGEVTARVARAFDTERITRRFYDQFQAEHRAFLGFIQGVEAANGREWYASVMLNRLMFLYFIQRKGFLNGDRGYLRTKLNDSQARGQNRYYADFLRVLFFRGLACEPTERADAERRLLVEVPYLNGGIFLPHPIEEANPGITIPDAAFSRLFDFFDRYQWHLDDRPLRADNEINPDVLGYIFEKYINQKQMGAYYTKEDITGYICKYTILPFLLDKVELNVAQAMGDVDPYIYEAVKTEDYLPTETEREYAARRKRYEQIRADFAAGKIATVNDLITYNLDIQTFVEDYLRGPVMNATPIMLRRFYKALTGLTVLDPTCGSGAFLFAAMNILEPLYELCLDKMGQVVAGKDGAHYPDFREELARVGQHPNRRYFVLKSIIVNNLYGVDIMDEAVEICKLRLFLKLVAQVDDAGKVEPLPDIDFNIRAGNTLVGFATKEEIAPPLSQGFRLYNADDLLRKVADADRQLASFRAMQTQIGVSAALFKEAKERLAALLAAIRDDLDTALMQDYGLSDLGAFRRTHKPFHWYMAFNHVMTNGGFDVIVGNPPYVEYSKIKEYSIRGYQSEPSRNLYAFTMERASELQRLRGRFGVIVPSGAFSVHEAESLRQKLHRVFSTVWLSGYAIRPAKLFDGVDQRLAIYVASKLPGPLLTLYSSRYHHWYAEEREALFSCLQYVNVSHLNFGTIYPKAGNETALSLIERVCKHSKTAGEYLTADEHRGVLLHYHRSPGYWIRATDFEQYFKSATRTRSIHHFRDLYAVNADMAKFIGAILNSSLFFFWFMTIGNGRNLTGDDVKTFPVGSPTVETCRKTRDLFDSLMQDYRKNSVIRVRKDQEFQEFDQARSKPIIDEIDRVLAQHYGFTDEELDFIIHYDIKYRMGRDAESGDGGEG